MRDPLKDISRKQAKALLAAEAKRRRTGDWGAWEEFPNSLHNARPGWLGDVETCFRNRVFAVLLREVGDVRHLAVSSLSGRRPTWYEMQRIKDELVGSNNTAVEVYPPRDEIVDGANMFHLWVLPGALPFSLFTGERTHA